jgi:hypothetical protein
MSHNWGNSDAPLSMARPQGQPGMSQRNDGYDPARAYSVGVPGTGSQSRQNDKREHLKTFFGEPTRPPTTNRDYYEKELEDYPAAFTSSYGDGNGGFTPNGYLSRVLIEKAKASESWPLTRMAPLIHHSAGGLTFSWDEVRFNQHMLDREPEESTPRLLTQSKSSGSASMVRFGIALMLESNFAGTEIGRQTYLANLEQIRIATVETMSYGVMISILEHEPWVSNNEGQRGSVIRDKPALDRLFKEETSMFGIVHKEINGYDKIRAKLKATMSSRIGGAEGDFTVVPQGMGFYLQNTMDAKYYLDGHAADKDGIKSITGPAVVESRSFSKGEKTEGHDPCFRHVTIGGFQTLDDSNMRNQDVRNYTTPRMDIKGYEEDGDDWSVVKRVKVMPRVGKRCISISNSCVSLGCAFAGSCFDTRICTTRPACGTSTSPLRQ